jgi:AMP nucleosidase
MTHENEAAAIVERLIEEYDRSVSALRAALKAFLADGLRPDPADRLNGTYAYPELRLHWSGENGYPRISRAYARIGLPGHYATTVTRPAMFRDYLVEQLALMIEDFGVTLDVGRSMQEIPFPYVLDGGDLTLADVSAAEIALWFPEGLNSYVGTAESWIFE